MITKELLKQLTSEEKDNLILQLAAEGSLLRQELAKAIERIKVLEGQLSKNSMNSSKPPSSDGFRKPKSLRKQGERKTGGQNGHLGTTLHQVEIPDAIVTHTVELCETCFTSLVDVPSLDFERRQEFDLPKIEPVVTEHLAEIKICPACGCQTKGQFPEDITQPVQYGSRVKAMASYFSHYQLLPYGRLQELFEDVFKLPLSEGTLFNVTSACYRKLEKYETQIKQQLILSPVVHFDESGLRVMKELNWLHSASTMSLTHYEMHKKRGEEAMEDIGILPHFKGRAIHDHWKPYFHYGKKHGLCNAHHLRELTYMEEQYSQEWSKKMKKLLFEIKKEVDAHQAVGDLRITPKRLSYFSRKYSHILKEGLKEIPAVHRVEKKRGKPKQHPSRNLADRLRDFKQETLAFMYDFTVDFTNNRAEQDIRMIKVKQKISGCFRSHQGSKMFLRVRGYISTARKNALNPLDALTDAFMGIPFIPSPAS
ncbi:MAG: IS66 family transposase [Parachlamydiaceae bacterium]